jgi:hypothetical protein
MGTHGFKYTWGMSTKLGKDTGAGPRGGKTTVTKSGLIRTVVYLHPDERKALRLASAEREQPASEIMREALRQYLGIEE